MTKKNDKATARDRFWSKVDRPNDPTACWEWIGGKDSGGYGQITQKGRTMKAHRVSFAEKNGPSPSGMDVLHTCDNPPCVNPEHLWLGTQLDNTRDMISKGRCKPATGDRHGWRTHPESILRGKYSFPSRHPERYPRGEYNPKHKLMAPEVIEIRRAYTVGSENKSSLARKFHVTPKNIRLIVTGKTWRHLLTK